MIAKNVFEDVKFIVDRFWVIKQSLMSQRTFPKAFIPYYVPSMSKKSKSGEFTSNKIVCPFLIMMKSLSSGNLTPPQVKIEDQTST